MKQLLVAKVGGSLFDLPDLRERLRSFISRFADHRIILVPGGGAGADVIRTLDATHRLGEERSHWLALRLLAVNAHFLSELLHVPIVATLPTASQVSILDPFAFCQRDEGQSGSLEHSWQATSDSIAARIAIVGQGQVVLLKSTEISKGLSWKDAGRIGLVDLLFGDLVERGKLDVKWINLRQDDTGLLSGSEAS